jgi:ferrous iron transport protein B
MQLPRYHAPNWRAMLSSMWQRILDFGKGAGTTILLVSMLLWVLSDLPHGSIDSSYVAMIGRRLEPAGKLLGWDWQLVVALLTSFVRKENVIATIGVLYGSAQGGANLGEALRAALTPAAALSFLVVQMLFIPCVATLASMWRETRSWRWTISSVLLLLVISFGSGLLVYHLARALGL